MHADGGPTELSPAMFRLLAALDAADRPVGARVAMRSLAEAGISASEATVARLLGRMDRLGYTERVGRAGRRLTESGRQSLEQARFGYQTGRKLGRALDIQESRSLLDLLHLRRGVENEAAALAAKRAAPEDLERLARNVEAYRRIGDSLEGRDEVGQSFHSLVIAAARSPLLDSIDSILRPKVVALDPVMNIITSGHGTHGEAPIEHERVFTAIAAGDAEAARTAMTAHLDRFLHEAEDFVGANHTDVVARLLTLQRTESSTG